MSPTEDPHNTSGDGGGVSEDDASFSIFSPPRAKGAQASADAPAASPDTLPASTSSRPSKRKRSAPTAAPASAPSPAAAGFNAAKAAESTKRRRVAHRRTDLQQPAFVRLLKRHADNNRVFVRSVAVSATKDGVADAFARDVLRPVLRAPAAGAGDAAAQEQALAALRGVTFPRVSPELLRRDQQRPGKVFIYAFVELRAGRYAVGADAAGDATAATVSSEDLAALVVKRDRAAHGEAARLSLPQYRMPFSQVPQDVEEEEEGEGGNRGDGGRTLRVSGLSALVDTTEDELRLVLANLEPTPRAVRVAKGRASALLRFDSAAQAMAVHRTLNGSGYAEAAAFGRCDALAESAVLRCEIVA